MPRTLLQHGARRGATAARGRLLPGVAAMLLATATLTGCSADQPDITAPTVQAAAVEGASPRVGTAPKKAVRPQATLTKAGSNRSGFLLSTGKDGEEDQK